MKTCRQLFVVFLWAGATLATADELAHTAKIKLPGDKVLDLSIFEASVTTLMSENDEKNTLRIPHPDSGKPFATLPIRNNKLHGWCIVQHVNGSPMMIGRYDEGNRDGPFRWTADDGRVRLDAQFRNGKEHGFVCYYRDGIPALVMECTAGKPRRSHRIEGSSVAESCETVPGRSLGASDATVQLIDAYSALARDLRKNEYAMKELVRDIIDDIRQQRAAARSVWTTQMMMQRMNDRAAQDAAVISALRAASGL